eukprot:103329_1
MASGSSQNNDLSQAQSETYAMLLNMGFTGSNAITAARIYGSNVSAAVNYLTSEPPQSFYHPQPQQIYTQQTQTQIKKEEAIEPKQLKYKSPDDIQIENILTRIHNTMQTMIDEDEIM